MGKSDRKGVRHEVHVQDSFMPMIQGHARNTNNIRRRFPVNGNAHDQLLLLSICRVNLDSCWAREQSKVQENQDKGVCYVKHEWILGVSMDLIS